MVCGMAKNKEEAFLQIDLIVAELDTNSMMELHAPGFVNFTVDLDEQEEVVCFLPPEEDVQGGYWLVFGGALGQIDNVDEYMLEVVPKKRRTLNKKSR